MSRTVSRTIAGMSMTALVVISPATKTTPVVTRVSIATRDCSSLMRAASSRLSEIWSAILSGCPSVTDSEVNREPPFTMRISFRTSKTRATSLAERPENTGVAGQMSTESYGALAQQILQGQGQVATRGDLQGVRRTERGAEGFRLRHLEVDGAGARASGQKVPDPSDRRVDEARRRNGDDDLFRLLLGPIQGQK